MQCAKCRSEPLEQGLRPEVPSWSCPRCGGVWIPDGRAAGAEPPPDLLGEARSTPNLDAMAGFARPATESSRALRVMWTAASSSSVARRAPASGSIGANGKRCRRQGCRRACSACGPSRGREPRDTRVRPKPIVSNWPRSWAPTSSRRSASWPMPSGSIPVEAWPWAIFTDDCVASCNCLGHD
jgi:hypothetical protein